MHQIFFFVINFFHLEKIGAMPKNLFFNVQLFFVRPAMEHKPLTSH
jgi:hypothetical protein